MSDRLEHLAEDVCDTKSLPHETAELFKDGARRVGLKISLSAVYSAFQDLRAPQPLEFTLHGTRAYSELRDDLFLKEALVRTREEEAQNGLARTRVKRVACTGENALDTHFEY